MDLLERLGQAGKEGKLPYSMYFMPSEDVVQTEGGSFHLKRSGLKDLLGLIPDEVK